MARPSSLTDERREAIERALAAGAPLNVAAASAGVAPRSVSRWLTEGRIVRRELSAVPEADAPADGDLPDDDEAIQRELLASVLRAARGRPGALERAPTATCPNDEDRPRLATQHAHRFVEDDRLGRARCDRFASASAHGLAMQPTSFRHQHRPRTDDRQHLQVRSRARNALSLCLDHGVGTNRCTHCRLDGLRCRRETKRARVKPTSSVGRGYHLCSGRSCRPSGPTLALIDSAARDGCSNKAEHSKQ